MLGEKEEDGPCRHFAALHHKLATSHNNSAAFHDNLAAFHSNLAAFHENFAAFPKTSEKDSGDGLPNKDSSDNDTAMPDRFACVRRSAARAGRHEQASS